MGGNFEQRTVEELIWKQTEKRSLSVMSGGRS